MFYYLNKDLMLILINHQQLLPYLMKDIVINLVFNDNYL